MRSILVLCAIAIAAGCSDARAVARDAALANLAASSWEAAAAIRAGVPADAPAMAIQANATASLHLLQATYAPAGVTAP